jgi:hypothetical protein
MAVTPTPTPTRTPHPPRIPSYPPVGEATPCTAVALGSEPSGMQKAAGTSAAPQQAQHAQQQVPAMAWPAMMIPGMMHGMAPWIGMGMPGGGAGMPPPFPHMVPNTAIGGGAAGGAAAQKQQQQLLLLQQQQVAAAAAAAMSAGGMGWGEMGMPGMMGAPWNPLQGMGPMMVPQGVGTSKGSAEKQATE